MIKGMAAESEYFLTAFYESSREWHTAVQSSYDRRYAPKRVTGHIDLLEMFDRRSCDHEW